MVLHLRSLIYASAQCYVVSADSHGLLQAQPVTVDTAMMRTGCSMLRQPEAPLLRDRQRPLEKREAQVQLTATELDGVYWRAAAGTRLRRMSQSMEG